MAKKSTSGTSSTTDLNTAKTVTYYKGMIKDYNDSYVPEAMWINAINAVTNSHKGDAGTIGNEPSNLFCVEASYTVIGLVRRDSDVWIVFSTNNVISEVGYFTESTCEYRKIVADTCLGFKKEYLITGVAQYNFDCTWSVFFADGLNPDRTINLDNPPYQYTWDRTNPDCPIKVFNECLDCEQTRLNYLMNPPCINVKKAIGAGSLLNGSYQAVIAYTINGQKVSNYFSPSNIQGIWDHLGVAGGLEISIEDLDTRFEEYELVIVANINNQSFARKIGNYSTSQTVVYLDIFSESLPSVPLNTIPLVIPIYEKSDKMFSVNNYLLRSGIYSKYEFNYQPLANNIVTYWQEVEYSSDYYYKGGSNTSYMRDEQYAFFIRWIYNDGDKSASYHIPGRPAQASDLLIVNNADVLYPDDNKYWQVYNTATMTSSSVNQTLPDGGIVTKEGLMGYWQSTEKYPINRPQVWGDLCGLPIRHHKFPDNCVSHIHSQGGDKIYILGVKFDNIQHPLDNDGNPILNIIGYEILRGSREGNRTIIAKGMLNNMREYTSTGNQKVLYQNFPYNDLNPDYFHRTSLAQNQGESPDDSGSPLTVFKTDYYSFHSPETNFSKPFLSYNEVRLYTKEYGSSSGQFEYPYGHPKHKLITDFSYILALTFGLSIALKAAFGQRNITKTADDSIAFPATVSTLATYGLFGVNGAMTGAIAGYTGAAPLSISSGNIGGYWAGTTGGTIGGNSGSISFPQFTETGGDLSGLTSGLVSQFPGYTNKFAQIAGEVAKYALFLSTISYWAGLGLDAALNVIYELIPFRQYALQFNSHAFYSNYKPVCTTNMGGSLRRENVDSTYIRDQIQNFDLTYNINNLYRNAFVAVKIKGNFPTVSDGDTSLKDDSRKRVRDTNLSFTNPTNTTVTAKTSAYYAGLKIDLENQYGQLEGIVQIPIGMCYEVTSGKIPSKRYESATLFGGDIYVNRYTEKNPFFFFVNWLYDVPNGTEFDYSQYGDVLYPRYWGNFTRFDRSNIKSPTSFGAIKGYTNGDAPLLGWIQAASSYHHLDRSSSTNTFLVTKAWFYMFYNGIRDFYVESEVNLAYRDYGDLISQRHYDSRDYTDYRRMFRTDIIQSGNYYKYDYSLSVSKLLSQYISFSAILPRSYDPNVAETCYTYNSGKVLYSLQQQSEQARESWRIYLPNNYKDFEYDVTAFKPINRTGALILFQDAEPTSFTGVDLLQTGAGTKITIGDGGLFAQPFQSLVNADDEYEYGSCQDTRSVVNTPYGTFWMSRNTGKILNYTGSGIVDIAMNGMRYWFAEHLPYVLTTQYPEFPFIENTVVGIGCLAVYDPQYELIYFSKRDFKAKYESVKYSVEGKYWYVNRQAGMEVIELGDPTYFENCSWTISYDPKNKMWISFHDWQPNHAFGVNDHFYTIKDKGFWKHNDVCDSFCNYYGVEYPFEVEVPINTGTAITTIKSVEYYMEALNYSQDCIDPYHVLDANFDYAMIYNTEQNSGLLKLNLKPYNPNTLLSYPIVLTDRIEIVFAKEENKYRFNQFWDATKDRGEFSGIQYRMFNTEQNGYRKVLNPTFIDYNKSPLQRKKFRHYGNRLILGKTVSQNLKYNLKVASVKETSSPR
jgi:hypothetical protein